MGGAKKKKKKIRTTTRRPPARILPVSFVLFFDFQWMLDVQAALCLYPLFFLIFLAR
jgi:hypothetical protein